MPFSFTHLSGASSMETGPEKALQLVDQILSEQLESLSEQDLTLLMDYKEVCTRKILPILALEITQIKERDPWDPKKLQGSLKLAAFFEEERAFDWVIQLHEFIYALEDKLELFFVPLYWADILAGISASSIPKLKIHIENETLDENIREACVDALLILLARNKINRSEVLDYFKALYKNLVSGTLTDPVLASILVEASLCIWPGECLEEIKELYGLGIVDDEYTSLSEILEAFEESDAFSLESLQEWVLGSHVLHPLVKGSFQQEEDLDFSQEEDLFHDFSDDSELDDLDFEEEDFEDLPTLEEEIAISPLIPCPEIQHLPQKEQKKYASLPRLLIENPEEVINITSEMLLKQGPIPALFNYLHSALSSLNAKVQAMETLKQWISLFPTDLFAKIEYGHYFLQRGEPEKVEDLFSNTWTLFALYPQRTSFAEIEYLKFFHLLGCYYVQIEDFEKAEGTLQVLDAMNPNSFEYYHLQRKIERAVSKDSFVDDF